MARKSAVSLGSVFVEGPDAAASDFEPLDEREPGTGSDCSCGGRWYHAPCRERRGGLGSVRESPRSESRSAHFGASRLCQVRRGQCVVSGPRAIGEMPVSSASLVDAVGGAAGCQS